MALLFYMDSFYLQPASAHPVSLSHLPYYPKCKNFFLALSSYALYICLAQSFLLAELIHFLCTILPECSRCRQLNISGSWSLPRPTTKITPLIVRQLLSLNCRNSYLFVFLLHEFTRPLRALTYLCRPRTQQSSWSLLCSKNSETLVQTSLQFEFIALPFWPQSQFISHLLIPHIL